MRKVLLLFFILVFSFVDLWLNPSAVPGFIKIKSQLIASTHTLLYRKSVNITGLKLLSDADLKLEGYAERSNLWWLFNRAEIEQALRSNALIQEVNLSPCSLLSFSCFNLKIEERNPELLASMGKGIWLVGSDGGFISPIPGEESFNQKLKQLIQDKKIKSLNQNVIVTGLLPNDASLNILKPRFEYVKNAIGNIEAETALKVKKVQINDSGEMEVKFENFPFLAVFGVGQHSADRLGKEVRRLTRILKEFKGREENLQRIDLAFDALAVVKLNQDVSAADL